MDRSEPVAESPSLRPLPIASSILWTPHDVTAWAEADGGAFPIFVAQSALAAIHEHVGAGAGAASLRSEEHTSELQSQSNLVCRLLLEKKKKTTRNSFKLLYIRRFAI